MVTRSLAWPDRFFPFFFPHARLGHASLAGDYNNRDDREPIAPPCEGNVIPELTSPSTVIGMKRNC